MNARDSTQDEFALIADFFQPLQARALNEAVHLGIGDDAALLSIPPGEVLVTSVDTLVAGRHYPLAAPPEDIGYRALAVAASDLAAMGAQPLGCTLALTLPEADRNWLRGFSAGLGEAIADFQLPLIGGDTTRGPAAVVTMQVFGSVPPAQALRRSGALAGHSVCVSGTLGDGAAALAMLKGDWAPAAELAPYLHRRFYRPEPQFALGQALRGIASAAIDISDGLLADLGHICKASGVGMRLHSAALPVVEGLRGEEMSLDWALRGGDDYQLGFTLPSGLTPPPGCSIIGEVLSGQSLLVDGEEVETGGFRHF